MEKILFVASEAVPYVKTGGLADVIGALPKAINKERYDVRVFLPKYACIPEELRKKIKHVSHCYVNLAWRMQYAGIQTAEYEGIQYYFIDNEYYFAGEVPYNNIYEDVEKYAYFCKAVLDALVVLDFQPDVIHCNDWQTALLPVYLKTIYQDQPFYQGIRTVFTIHNMEYQGRWKLRAVMDITGLPPELFTPKGLEAYGESNYLKGGIVYSDRVTTVSNTYAYEITTSSGGAGLHGVVNKYLYKICGIMNGIDNDEYNPQNDDKIYYLFGEKDVKEAKRKNKLAFQRECNLKADDDIMMIGMVSRLTEQKGFALLEYMLDELLSDGRMQFVVLGTGEIRYEETLYHFSSKYPDRFKVMIGYSEDMAHKIYAASDAFLMPSQFEPCGLSQLICYRYGTVPIVRKTGGLKDTVIPYNALESSGTGFCFENFNAHEMKEVIFEALNLYRNSGSKWDNLMKNGRKQDYSWAKSAKKYEQLYDELCQ